MSVLRACARITLALDIEKRLEEGPFSGYHRISAIKHRIDICDGVKVTAADSISLEVAGNDVVSNRKNLCWKAAERLRKEAGISSGVHITLHKHIPAAGGLAGGSADAAAVLALCNTLWDCGFSVDRLAAIGQHIGMDIPYFFYSTTALDTETTLDVDEIQTDLTFDFVLVRPPFGVSTPFAYSCLDYMRINMLRDRTQMMKEGFKANDRAQVVASMHNDFERFVFEHFPQLGVIKQQLLHYGCETALMSGSGSTMIGVAKDRAHARHVAESIDWDAQAVRTCDTNANVQSVPETH